jgi:DNA primase
MIPSQTIEDIRNKTDIIAVISEHVKLRKTGKNYVGLCPFHSEKTPSFTVSPDKQLFHCFGCGEGGNVFSFVMKAENISFTEALEELASRVGIMVAKQAPTGVSRSEKDRLYDIVSLANKFFIRSLEEEGGHAAREYLKQRALNETTVKTFQLGYAPDGWDHLFKHLLSRGAAPRLIELAGLTLPRENQDGYYDRFRSRLIFPILDLRGRPIAFSGRALGNEEPKYLNSPDTPIYHKGENVFGLSLTKEQIKKEKNAVLVEGNLDLISVFQAGILNLAAPLGTALTIAQCKLLSRFTDNMVLAFDADAAGETAAERSAELLRAQGGKVKIAELKGAKDPDELVRKEGAVGFKNALQSALPYLEFKIRKVLSRHDLAEIESRARALREVAGILNPEKDPFVQKEYAKMAAPLLKVDPEAILSEARRLNFYRQGAAKDLRRVTEKPNSKIAEAEGFLIGLALQKKALLELLKKEISAEEFTLPEFRSIAKILLAMEPDEGSDPAHVLMDNLPNESEKKLLARILIKESPEDPEKVLNDCVRTIKTERVKDRIESLKAELRAAEKAGEAQKSAELLSALKNEIS